MSKNEAWQTPKATLKTYQHTRATLLMLLLLGSAGCTTTTSLVRVKDETIGRPQYTKIVVSTPTDDLEVRDNIERLFAEQLGNYIVSATRAMDVLPPLREYSQGEVDRRLDSVGARLLLVIAVADFWQTYYATPSTTVTETRSQSSTSVSQWGNLLSANTTGSSTSTSRTVPGITFTQSNVKLDARVFQIDPQSPPLMIWRSTSTTSGDYFVGKSKVMLNAAREIARQLVSDSLLRGFERFREIIVLGGPNHDIMLGGLDPWQPGSGSLFDKEGRYGRNASQSVWHREGLHASDTSACSICNPNASNPPIVVDENGKVIGRLSISKAFDIGYETDVIRRRIAQEICKRKSK